MPEYRQDPLTGRTVIIAEERAARPHQFDIEDSTAAAVCPFCEGNEHLTPEEVAALRNPGSVPNFPGWFVRVIPNKFPAVMPEKTVFPFSEPFDVAPGVGNHEVIVDTPRHVLSVVELTDTEVASMFQMYRDRLRTLRSEQRWSYVQIFKNVGAAAGASIPHSHSQLVAMPFIPQGVQQVLHHAEKYRNTHSTCFWCDRLDRDIQNQTRIVEETPQFVALCPFVSRFAGEVEIYPKKHQSGFDEMTEKGLAEFALLVRRTVSRLEQVVLWMKGKLAYNFVLNTEPISADRGVFHWHLSILPSLARAAGFEWGTGLHINPISPEQAAERLRCR
jgi:UDPglucose--hexose-1-phosphate uridylyltransferase